MKANDVLGSCCHDCVKSVCHHFKINIHHKEWSTFPSNCGLDWLADVRVLQLFKVEFEPDFLWLVNFLQPHSEVHNDEVVITPNIITC